MLEKRFNEALIYYSQIQKSLKNHTLGQEARFKIAKTSFYKGDFDWALTQLKVLRNSTSQLIANDAMHLSLLISDNTFQDSTQVALKKYATADFMAFQGKTKEAISIIDQILEEHKGAKIEDEALFKQGQLLEQQKNYEKAKLNYLKILDFFKEDILADNALFALAKLYDEQFEDKVLAKKYYEQLIFEYEDSIYFQEARKRYRILRGDDIN
jgi:tetratricopeptide (TPR) repeat protein